MTELINSALFKVHGAFLRQRTLSHTDNSVLLAHLETAFHRLGDVGDIERHLGNDRIVRAAGHARVQCNPAHVTAHDLHDEDTVMRLCGGVQTVNCIGRDGNCRIETEGVVGGVDIVVNSLWYTNDRNAIVGQPLRAL